MRFQDSSNESLLLFSCISSPSQKGLLKCSIEVQHQPAGFWIPWSLTVLPPVIPSFHGLTYSISVGPNPATQPVSLRYPLRNSFTAPISSSHSPQRHKWRRMLTRKPDTSFRATLPQDLNILVQLHLAVLYWIADLESRVRAKPCHFVILPIRGKDLGWLAAGGRGRVPRKERVVWVEEGVEARRVFLGGGIEILNEGGDVLSTGPVEVEEKCWVRARSREGGERDAFRGPAFGILLWSIRGRKKLGEECRHCAFGS